MTMNFDPEKVKQHVRHLLWLRKWFLLPACVLTWAVILATILLGAGFSWDFEYAEAIAVICIMSIVTLLLPQLCNLILDDMDGSNH